MPIPQSWFSTRTAQDPGRTKTLPQKRTGQGIAPRPVLRLSLVHQLLIFTSDTGPHGRGSAFAASISCHDHQIHTQVVVAELLTVSKNQIAGTLGRERGMMDLPFPPLPNSLLSGERPTQFPAGCPIPQAYTRRNHFHSYHAPIHPELSTMPNQWPDPHGLLHFRPWNTPAPAPTAAPPAAAPKPDIRPWPAGFAGPPRLADAEL